MGIIFSDDDPTPTRLDQLIKPRCHDCYDTNIAITMFGIGACPKCEGARESRTRAAWKLAAIVHLRLEKQQEIDSCALSVARVLAHFTSAQPVTSDALELVFNLSRRSLSAVIERLRHEWLLPVGSRLTQPNGYWIIIDPDDFLTWFSQYRSRPLTALQTAHRLMRNNFPALAGQAELAFAESIETALQEEQSR